MHRGRKRALQRDTMHAVKNRMQHLLIVFVGPPGVGKTYFADYLVRRHPDTFAITRSVTTREPRNADDYEHYEFLDEVLFAEGVAAGRILATAQVRGKQYGLDLAYIREMLRTHHGIIALVAETVELLRTIPDLASRLRIIFLKPETEAVLEKNLAIREQDPEQRAANLALAKTWQFPDRPDGTLIVRGKEEQLPELAQQLFSRIASPITAMQTASEKRILIGTVLLLAIVAGVLGIKYVGTVRSTTSPAQNAQVSNTTPPTTTPATAEETSAVSQAEALLPESYAAETIHRLGEHAFWIAAAKKQTGPSYFGANYFINTAEKTVTETGDSSLVNAVPRTVSVENHDLAGAQFTGIKQTIDWEGHIESTEYFRLDGIPTYLATISWWNRDTITFTSAPQQGYTEIELEKTCVPDGAAKQTCTITGLKEGDQVATFKTPQTLGCDLNEMDGACRFATGLGKPSLSMGRTLTFTLPWGTPVSIDLEHPFISTTSEAFEKPYPFQ